MRTERGRTGSGRIIPSHGDRNESASSNRENDMTQAITDTREAEPENVTVPAHHRDLLFLSVVGCSGSAVSLYLWLCAFAGESRTARYPGTTAMSRLLGVYPSTARRAEQELERGGLIRFDVPGTTDAPAEGEQLPPRGDRYQVLDGITIDEELFKHYRQAQINSRPKKKRDWKQPVTFPPEGKQTPRVQLADKTPPTAEKKPRAKSARSNGLTQDEKILLSTNLNLMERYLRFGVPGVRNPDDATVKSTAFDWWACPDGPKKWTVQQFAAFYWASVCYARSYYGRKLQIPDFGQLMKFMSGLYERMDPTRLYRFLSVLCTKFEYIKAEAGEFAAKAHLGERTLTHGTFVTRTETLIDMPDAQIDAWAQSIELPAISNEESNGEEGNSSEITNAHVESPAA